MTAPRYQPRQWCRDYVTGILVQIVEPLAELHPRTGQRLYLTKSRTGRERRLQERNLKPAF